MIPAKNPETPNLDLCLARHGEDIELHAGMGQNHALRVPLAAAHVELHDLKLSLSQMREEVERLRAGQAEATEILATVEPPIRDKRAIAALARLDATNNASVTHESYFIVGWCARNEEVEKLRAKAALADQTAEAYRESLSLWDWESEWLDRYNGLERHAAIGEEGR